MIQPEPQAEWHMATGYYAINQKAYELDSVKQFYEENPLFEVAVEQIMNSNTDAVGPLMPPIWRRAPKYRTTGAP